MLKLADAIWNVVDGEKQKQLTVSESGQIQIQSLFSVAHFENLPPR
jgi:hypothetical protein